MNKSFHFSYSMTAVAGNYWLWNPKVYLFVLSLLPATSFIVDYVWFGVNNALLTHMELHKYFPSIMEYFSNSTNSQSQY